MVTLEESQQITKVMRFIEDMALNFCRTLVVDTQSGWKWCTDINDIDWHDIAIHGAAIPVWLTRCEFSKCQFGVFNKNIGIYPHENLANNCWVILVCSEPKQAYPGPDLTLNRLYVTSSRSLTAFLQTVIKFLELHKQRKERVLHSSTASQTAVFTLPVSSHSSLVWPACQHLSSAPSCRHFLYV